MPTLEELTETVTTLERHMKRLTDDRSIGAAIDGKFSLKWPVRIQGPNGDAYIVVRKPGGLLATVPAAEFEVGDWTDGDTYELLPIGSIVAFKGAEADVPPGWHLCDGTEGTDDLSDKFILGGDWDTTGTNAAQQDTAIGDHSALSDHTFTQPTAHGSSTVVRDIADTGSGVNVLLSYDLTNNHSGGAVDAHSTISAHSVSTQFFPAYWQYALIQRIA
jgi:hypothetical protein